MRSMKNLLAASAIVVSGFIATSQAFAADIVDTAIAAGNFKTLVAAVQAAGLVDTLKGVGPFTVFAPTDEAFAKGTSKHSRTQTNNILMYTICQGAPSNFLVKFPKGKKWGLAIALFLAASRAAFSSARFFWPFNPRRL